MSSEQPDTLHENAPSTGSLPFGHNLRVTLHVCRHQMVSLLPQCGWGQLCCCLSRHKPLPVGGGGTSRNSQKYFPTGSCQAELMRHDTNLTRNNVLTFRACSPCSQPPHCHCSQSTGRGIHFCPELVSSTPLRCHCRGRPGNPSRRQLCNR